jgi:hypothetical protein
MAALRGLVCQKHALGGFACSVPQFWCLIQILVGTSGVEKWDLLLPVGVVPNHLIDRAGANIFANGPEFGAVFHDGFLEGGLFL